jgi:NitT/TauT family transport system permease protein
MSSKRLRLFGLRLLCLALFLLCWQGANMLQLWPDYLFPSPTDVLRSLWQAAVDGSLPAGLLRTLQRIAVGFCLAAAGGLLLGMAVARGPALEATVGPIVAGLQALPSICWYPLAILWFGLSEKTILFVTVAGALFSVASATISGVQNIPPLYLRAATTMGASGLNLYLWVVLPAALPSLLSGLRQGWAFAWRSLMAAELLFLNRGLGALLMIGREFNDVAQLFGVILTILGIGWAIDRLLFARIEASVRRRWGLTGA